MMRCNLLTTLALAAVFCFTSGCGKKTENKKTEGDKRDTTTRPAKELFVGTWQVEFQFDDEKSIAKMKKDAANKKSKVSDEDLKKQYEFLKNMIMKMKMSVIFNSDGTADFETESPNPFDANQPPSKKSEKSRWEIVSEDGKKVTLKVTPMEGRMKDKAKEFTITIVDNDNFTVDEVKGEDEMPPGMMTFKRK